MNNKTIMLNDNLRLFKNNTNLAIHTAWIANDQWVKDAAIMPCAYKKSWLLTYYRQKYPCPLQTHFDTLSDVSQWVFNNYKYKLPIEAIEHLERLEAKMLMTIMVKS